LSASPTLGDDDEASADLDPPLLLADLRLYCSVWQRLLGIVIF
jgi:hypothetical protein